MFSTSTPNYILKDDQGLGLKRSGNGVRGGWFSAGFSTHSSLSASDLGPLTSLLPVSYGVGSSYAKGGIDCGPNRAFPME